MGYRITLTLGLVVLLLASLPTGCSLKRMGVRTTAEIIEDGIVAFEAEPDPILAREAAASQIKLLEALHLADPKNKGVLLSSSRALGSYAFAFLEMDAERDPATRERAAKLYRRGADYGLRLLEKRLGKGTHELAETGTFDVWQKRLKRAKKKDVPALFWTAYSWANSIRKSVSSPKALAALPRAIAIMERVLTLNPNYHYGAAHLFMGVYYADRPRLAGGNPKLAQKHFTEAIRISNGRYVLGHFLWARYLTVAVQDIHRFQKLLETVLKAPDDLLPEQRLSQEIAKIWAGSLLKNKSDYFAEE